jgi:PAS domain S-box-containing protein
MWGGSTPRKTDAMVVATDPVLGQRSGEERLQAQVRTSQVAATDLGVGLLFDRLLDAVVIARLSTGRIVMWNAAAEKLFGYAEQEVVGESIEMLMPEPIAHVHRVGLERYLRTGHGLIADAGAPVEMPARRKDGEGIRIELSLSEIQDQRGERFAVAVIRDATQRKQLELTNLELVQTRVARDEAEAAVAARDLLLDAVAATLEAAVPASDELARLLGALSDFKRLHTGQLALRPQDADLVDFVHAAADAVRDRAPDRRILVHAPPTVPATFDLERTIQVLEQVLDEAIHRSGQDSRIELRLDQPTAQIARLTIRTEGTGATRELGVGLHLGRSLIQRQGGTMRAVVTSGGGLEVVLTLPACPRPVRRNSRRLRTAGGTTTASGTAAATGRRDRSGSSPKKSR